MCKIHEVYTESKSYSGNLMTDIEATLSAKKMKYSLKAGGKEIVVQKQSKKTIEKLLRKKLSISEASFNMMIEIVEVNENTYIRQKVK